MTEYKQNKLIRIKVGGVGSAGISCLDRLESLVDLEVERYAVGLSSKAMHQAGIKNKIILSPEHEQVSEEDCTPERAAALLKAKKNELQKCYEGADMVFIAGSLAREMVGQAMAIIGNMARQAAVPVFATATIPFSFEGKRKQAVAERYDNSLIDSVDSLISIQSDAFLKDNIKAMEALTAADSTLEHTIKSLLEIVDTVGEINVDFNDFKSIIENAGRAFIGSGRSKRTSLKKCLTEATENSYFNHSLKGTKRVLYIITAGSFISMEEMEYIGDYIAKQANQDARIIFGLVVDEKMEEEIRLTVLASEIPE
jgi:cell division protein FtsZ